MDAATIRHSQNQKILVLAAGTSRGSSYLSSFGPSGNGSLRLSGQEGQRANADPHKGQATGSRMADRHIMSHVADRWKPVKKEPLKCHRREKRAPIPRIRNSWPHALTLKSPGFDCTNSAAPERSPEILK
jgi:hypothetical protein